MSEGVEAWWLKALVVAGSEPPDIIGDGVETPSSVPRREDAKFGEGIERHTAAGWL